MVSEFPPGRTLLTIDVLHDGTRSHEIDTSESRDNTMKRRNIRRTSRVIQVCDEELTNIGDEPTSKTEVSTVPDSQFSAILRFDVFEIDLPAGELRKEGRRIKVQEQPFHVLSVLLQHAGQVVTREELRTRLWPADTFVDFDQSLNKAVKRLRESLNDPADHPRFIETLPRRGYRFIGSVKGADQESQIVRTRARKFAFRTLIFAPVIILAIAFFVWFTKRLSAPQPEMKIRQLTTNSDENPVRNGSISPDGTRCWSSTRCRT